MSKMPAKKKSCFQITSVTQAQVAASSITDDTESLDDPDESRTEDVSSEILDVSRDFEPEVCDICSSEETLNSVAECETGVGPADGHHAAASGPPNGGFVFRNSNAVNASSHGVGGTGPGPAPQPTSAPAASSSTTTTSFSTSSRFRVIKLDHGTGEPFKRGRWTCTEFYEKDSEGSTASRSVDGTKHAGPLDHNSDSGPGATGGAVAAHGAHPPTQTEPLTDSGYVPPPHVPPVELHQQGYVVQAAGLGPGPSQTLIPSGHNGVHQPPPIQQAKSPNMPPISAAQQFYPVQQTQQQPGQNLPPAMPLNPADYRQQQNPPVALLSIGAAVSQSPSPVMTPAAGPTHMLGPVAQSVEPAGPGAVRLPAPVTVPHSGGGVAAGSMPMQPVGQHQQPAATGSAVPHALIPGAQNVPATAAALPSASGVPPQTVPPQVQTAGLGLAGQILQNQAQAAAARGGLAVCGFTSTPPAGTPQSEEVQRKTALRASGGAVGTDPLKPLVPESLQLAAAPVVNSLFGIPITMDGDEDRNPSTAFYQAFPSSRLRDSKAPADSASGASVVAIDNKIEQAMDLVKSHLMYAVREEVEVLKEQIKELYERNSVLERENAVLKSLANSDQLSQLTTQLSSPGSASPPQQHPQPAPQGPAGLTDSSQTPLAPQQPNTSSA